MPTMDAVRARIGSAGHSGKDVRSDCRVMVEPTTQGGIQLELKSRVERYYGESIRQTAIDILHALHVGDAKVSIEDEGALPFALAARIEAAAREAGFAGETNLPDPVGARTMSPRDRMRRSRLYLPGAEPKYFVNARLYRPDAIILDLEDSVHPDDKFGARLLVRNALRSVDFGAAERMVRINQLPLGLQDLDAIIPQRPDLILLPKTETPQQVIEVDRYISQLEEKCGFTEKIWLMPILESALGIENAFAIATSCERVVALTIGLEDYTADLGVVKTRAGEETLFARARVVNAARAAGLQAIDSVYGDIGDLDGLRIWSEWAHALGFEGMGCVHPSQIEIVHQSFSPTALEIEKSMRIVTAFAEARAQGRSVVSVGSKMIDPPVVQRAVQVVKRARALGMIQCADDGRSL